MIDSTSSLKDDGYLVTPILFSPRECEQLAGSLPAVKGAGLRNLLEIEAFREVAVSLRKSSALAQTLTGLAAVQCILFDKSLSKNWSVQPHRDTIVPVKGTGKWRRTGSKDGMQTAQPPTSFLTRCLAVRVQLDGAPVEDISVVPRSHRDSLPRCWQDTVPVSVARGAILTFRPLLVHASLKLQQTSHRRVIHYLFAPKLLPYEYHWYHVA